MLDLFKIQAEGKKAGLWFLSRSGKNTDMPDYGDFQIDAGFDGKLIVVLDLDVVADEWRQDGKVWLENFVGQVRSACGGFADIRQHCFEEVGFYEQSQRPSSYVAIHLSGAVGVSLGKFFSCILVASRHQISKNGNGA